MKQIEDFAFTDYTSRLSITEKTELATVLHAPFRLEVKSNGMHTVCGRLVSKRAYQCSLIDAK